MKTTEGVVIEIKHKRKYGGVFQMMAGCDNDCGGALEDTIGLPKNLGGDYD